MARFILTEQERKRIRNLYGTLLSEAGARVNVAEPESSKNFACIVMDEDDGDKWGVDKENREYVELFYPNSLKIFYADGVVEQWTKDAKTKVNQGTWKCKSDNSEPEQTWEYDFKTGIPTIFSCIEYNTENKDNWGRWGDSQKKFLRQYSEQFDDGGYTLSVYWEDGSYQVYETTQQGGNADKLIGKGNWKCNNGEVETYNEQQVTTATTATTATTVTVSPSLEEVSKGTKTMKKGNQGEPVNVIQQMLMTKGYLKIPKPTGYFGDMTYQAVLQYQKDNNLKKQDGMVGPDTYASLYQPPKQEETAKTPDVNIQPKGITTQPIDGGVKFTPTQVNIQRRQ